MDYPVQEVELGYYEGKECVAIKLFDLPLIAFKGFGTTTADGAKINSKGDNYNLQWLIRLKMIPNKFSISQRDYNLWVWKVFIFDMFIGNFDRHEGNWGFFRENGRYSLAPLFDIGSCFYPHYINTAKMNMTEGELKNVMINQTKSAIY